MSKAMIRAKGAHGEHWKEKSRGRNWDAAARRIAGRITLRRLAALKLRLPLARKELRLGNLSGSHFAGNIVARIGV
jgi:hypothetical protein